MRAANWLTHLNYDLSSPVWSHWGQFLERNFDYLRFDERGCGLSDRNVGNLTFDLWVDDLEAVIEAANVPAPFVLLGVSQGAATAIGYACKYPDRVSHLVLYGGYARGSFHRGDVRAGELYRAIVDVFRLGWGKDNPAFQEVFTSRFIPQGTAEQRQWYNDLCQKTVYPEAGADLLLARADVDVTRLLGEVSVPTLIIHARNDAVIPLAEGELLAREIPGSQLAIVEGCNHILQAEEQGWQEFCDLVRGFTGLTTTSKLDGLTSREREVLKLICMAKTNKDIALVLGLNEKTVRNHATNLFVKLDVESRQEAILNFARYF